MLNADNAMRNSTELSVMNQSFRSRGAGERHGGGESEPQPCYGGVGRGTIGVG